MQVCQNLKSIHDCNLGYTVQKIKYKRPFKDHFHLLPQHLQPTLVFQNVSFRKSTQYFANIFQSFIDEMIFQVKTHRDLARSHMKTDTDGDETATSQRLFTLWEASL